jgi:hypothetical protein
MAPDNLNISLHDNIFKRVEDVKDEYTRDSYTENTSLMEIVND